MNYHSNQKLINHIKRWPGRNICLRSLRRCFAAKPNVKAKTDEKWISVVGLEIHAQIQSNSKLFSGASTEFASPINSNVSFFDCGTPGTLPVLNRRCVEAGILTALALSCKINEVSLFDRKHYFYADLPVGYQITQQRQALAVNGMLNFQVFGSTIHSQPYRKVSRIKQLQLEQDSGKSLHDPTSRRSLVDLNRAGVPLMELVFEPDLSDGEEAAALVKEIMLIFQKLGTCSCKMEEGALRVDANISVNRPGEKLGVRTEVKNIGSIRSVASAVKYEIDRQIAVIDNGGFIVNETRSWDAENQLTVPMRDKEEKQDYRYMPEPNLPPLHVHLNEGKENKYGLVDVLLLRDSLPELPQEMRDHLENKYRLDLTTAAILVNEGKLLNLFQAIIKENNKRDPKLVSNILINHLLTLVNKELLDLETCKLNERHLGEIIDMLQNKSINLIIAKQVLESCVKDPSLSPCKIIRDKKLGRISDENELIQICKDVLHKKSDAVEQYKSGKKKVLKSLIGFVAQQTQGRADMATVEDILKKLLDD